jgi:hypothetical protein
MYDERESKRLEDRKKGAAVIRAQMEERTQDRLRSQELKQQEQDAMLRHIEKMKEDDRREGERKRDASRRLMEDVALANAEQIRLKTRHRESEIEEDKRITEYLHEKEKREAILAEEHERVRVEKEREVARMRTKQEKAQDKQAELDALRAKRAAEAVEREDRRKERDEAIRVAKINRHLQVARAHQMREKESLLAEQAIVENEEFERIVAVQRAEDEIERQKRDLDVQKRRRHAQELKEQVAYGEEQKRKERREFVEEGIKQRKQREEEATKIELIRAEKLRELSHQGVPDRYRQELLRKRNGDTLLASK